MLPVDLPTLEALVPDVDAAVSRASHIDHFCSSSAWVLSANAALTPGRELYCRRGEHGWALLARRRTGEGASFLEALEAVWRLACPLVCDGDPGGLARDLLDDLAAGAPSDVLILSGLVAGSPLFDALIAALGRRYHVASGVVPATRRFLASLDGGVAGFLGRRSSHFRANLRQAARKAAGAGIRFEPVVVTSDAEARRLHARLLAVEAASWKGQGGHGLMVPEMAAFYREMLPRLARERPSRLRAQVASLEGRDVALIVGGVVPTSEGFVYRGLQFSFDDAHRGLSLGNLAQLAQIEELCREGVALYDLGSEVDYKRRWGELCRETVTLVAIPRSPRSPAV